jgi:hypothetical protein
MNGAAATDAVKLKELLYAPDFTQINNPTLE